MLLRHALKSLPRQLLTTPCEQILLGSERDFIPSAGLLVRQPYYTVGALGHLGHCFGALGALVWGTWGTHLGHLGHLGHSSGALGALVWQTTLLHCWGTGALGALFWGTWGTRLGHLGHSSGALGALGALVWGTWGTLLGHLRKFFEVLEVPTMQLRHLFAITHLLGNAEALQ